ncbi:melanocortin-2 receptor accessory protein 2A-like isoform X2 [Sander lucioperca]|uniref:melanocortin-2 receptor accessory protein 2A-like isoform X2 n=1 Tax=Sander lucioperca TaxID=283035 RepID=UPI0016537E66|nr:melanocortin-2 receptor accessory protein 2A-like isoform X2 [Sander lucioperca]
MAGVDGPNGTGASPAPDYEWRYEYYDDDEPVSFEGLKAHRYSIVIGFWVGLAVFVVFMFFLLTLLTKTGAPHPDSGQPCEKQPRVIGYMDTNLNTGALFPRPSALDSSSSLFQCFVSNEGQLNSRAGSVGGGAPGGCLSRPSSSLELGDGTLLQELAVLTHFNLPNCVDSEQSSAVGEDDMLLGEPELAIIGEGSEQQE